MENVAREMQEFVAYCLKHAPALRHHSEFGQRAHEIEQKINDLQVAYESVLLAAQGRGMVSEMSDMAEVAVLVCGLHDKIDELQAAQLQRESDA